MRSHYRYKIARSRKKFAQSGLKLARTTGRAAIEEIYTPALHAMYERVTCRAEHRLEILPREYLPGARRTISERADAHDDLHRMLT